MKQDAYYEYLDELRDSGLINMFSYDQAVFVLHCWMESHAQRSAC